MIDPEYRVYLVKLPGDIHGACRLDADGFPSIYINDDLSLKARRAALRHELRHIKENDHTNKKTIQEAET